MTLLRLPLYIFWLLVQSIALALGQIWANKARSILTTIGIVIGVASVTAVIAALTGLKANILTEFETFGTNKIFIIPQWPRRAPCARRPGTRSASRPSSSTGWSLCPSVAAYTMVVGYDSPVRYRDEERGERPGARHRSGLARDREPARRGRPVVLPARRGAGAARLPDDADLRDKLGLNRDCIGESLLIGSRLFTIIGVVAKATAFGGMQGPDTASSQVFVPFSTVWKDRQPWLHVIATSKSAAVSEEAVAELRFFLRRVRDLKPGEPDTFRLEAMERFLSQFKMMALMITAIAAGIVGISLLVGGVGIMNIMLVSVSERTREIGLRKAVGARPSAILLQFLVEAVMLCLVGGLLGLVVGQCLDLGHRGHSADAPGQGLHPALGRRRVLRLLRRRRPVLRHVPGHQGRPARPH